MKFLVNCVFSLSLFLGLVVLGCGKNRVRIEIKGANQGVRLDAEELEINFSALVQENHVFNEVKKGVYHLTAVYGDYFERKEVQVGPRPTLPWTLKTYSVSFEVPASQGGMSLEGTIAFDSDMEGSRNKEIFSIRLDGSGLTNLTQAGGSDTEPHWSPDGGRIAFVSNRAEEMFGKDIYVMNADGSGQTRLTFSGAKDYNPAWSPDGEKIAFCSERTGKPQIFLIDAAGKRVVQLSDETASEMFPVWSPDGKRIAFHSDRGGYDDIWVMNSDGTNLVQLTHSGGKDEYNWTPAWSPEGGRILFSSSRKGAREIYLMRSDGSWETRLTTTEDAYEWEPVWSPDGKGLAFAGNAGGNYEIYVMDTAGINVINLTKSDSNERHPSWRPF